MHPADLVYAIDKGRLLFTANVPGGVFPKGMLRDAKQNPEAASAIWSGMLHICASRSVLLDTQ